MSKVIGTFALLLSIGRIRGIPQLGAAYLTVGDPTQVEQVGRVGVGPGEPGSVLLVVEVNTTTPGIPSSRLSPVQKVGKPTVWSTETQHFRLRGPPRQVQQVRYSDLRIDADAGHRLRSAGV